MKFAILLLISLIYLEGSIDFRQNFRALYQDVELTKEQKSYILDSGEINSKVIRSILKKDLQAYKKVKDKHVVSFTYSPDGNVNNIRFLKESDNRTLDKILENAIYKASKKLIKPTVETEIRYIISYNIGSSNNYVIQSYNNSKSINQNSTKKISQPYYQRIPKGTTRFQHSSKEHVRTFETSGDGFINASVSPGMCGTMKVLTADNQYIRTGYSPWLLNAEIPKGKYKFLVKTKLTCDVHLHYK